MKRKTISILSTISLVAATLIALYVIVQNWFTSRSLPAGTCPVDSYRALVYAAIGLAVFSFILSFFEMDKDGGDPDDGGAVTEESDGADPEESDGPGTGDDEGAGTTPDINGPEDES